MNVCRKNHGNSASCCWDISVWIKAMLQAGRLYFELLALWGKMNIWNDKKSASLHLKLPEDGKNPIFLMSFCFQLSQQEEEQERGVQSETAPISETGEPPVLHHIYFCFDTWHFYSTPLPSLQTCTSLQESYSLMQHILSSCTLIHLCYVC